jgi:PAS domain S-box-containing protein
MSAAVVDLNNVKHIISVTHDITERKWAEEALRESDEKFRSLLDSQESNILMLDFDGVHHYVNQVGIASLTASGTAQDIIGKRLHDLYPAHIADWQLEQIRRVITTGQGMSGDFQSVVNDRASWWHLNLQPIRNASGQVVQVMVNSHDITERKQAEEDLRKSENRFHSLYDNASIGMYRTTPDGHILLLNPAGVRMLGYDSLEEITKRNLEEDGFEPGYERIKFHERMKREGDIVGLESVWDKKDGSKIYIRESATAVKDGSGTIIYYDGTFEDITARKQAEEALRESELKYRSLIESSSDAIFLCG